MNRVRTLLSLSEHHNSMIEERFPIILDDEASLDFEHRCYPNVYDIKVFRYRDDPPAYQILAGYDGIKDLIEELRAPSHFNRIYCARLSSAEALFKTGGLPARRFLDYSVERFGLRIEPFPAVSSKGNLRSPVKDSLVYVSQPSYWYEGSDYLVQVWRTRIFPCPVSAIKTNLQNPLTCPRHWGMYFEESWHPTRGKERSLHWIEHKHRNNSKIEQFRKDALVILDGLRRRGRPPITLTPKERAEFITKYQEACSIVAKKKNRSQRLVAQQMS